MKKNIPNIPILSSFRYALKGLSYVWRHEPNFRIHNLIALVVIALGFVLDFDIYKWSIIILCISLILSLEIINSAIEYTWNHLEPNHHPVVGTIKDVMASAVLVASIGVSIIGILIFLY